MPTTAIVKRGSLAEPFIWDYASGLTRYTPLLVADSFDARLDWSADRVTLPPARSGPRLVQRGARALLGREAYPFELPLPGGAGASLKRLLAERRPDVLHAQYGPTAVWLTETLGSKRPPLAVTFFCYDLFGQGKYPFWQEAYRRVFDSAELILALSGYIREFLIEMGCPPEKVEIDRLGVDPVRFGYRDPVARERTVILSVSHFQPKKGLIYLVRAFADVAGAHPDALLRLVGGGSEEARVRAEIAALGIGDRVELLPSVRYDALPAVYEDADIFVLPSVMSTDFDLDEISMVILQAMSVGLPVVTTHHAGIPEVITHGENGLLAEERDVESLAAALDRLLADRAAWPRLTRAARATIETELDVRKQVAVLEQRYDRMRAAAQ